MPVSPGFGSIPETHGTEHCPLFWGRLLPEGQKRQKFPCDYHCSMMDYMISFSTTVNWKMIKPLILTANWTSINKLDKYWQAFIKIINKAIVLMPSGFVPNGKARESCVIQPYHFIKWFGYLRIFPCAIAVQGFLIFWMIMEFLAMSSRLKRRWTRSLRWKKELDWLRLWWKKKKR